MVDIFSFAHSDIAKHRVINRVLLSLARQFMVINISFYLAYTKINCLKCIDLKSLSRIVHRIIRIN